MLIDDLKKLTLKGFDKSMRPVVSDLRLELDNAIASGNTHFGLDAYLISSQLEELEAEARRLGLEFSSHNGNPTFSLLPDSEHYAAALDNADVKKRKFDEFIGELPLCLLRMAKTGCLSYRDNCYDRNSLYQEFANAHGLELEYGYEYLIFRFRGQLLDVANKNRENAMENLCGRLICLAEELREVAYNGRWGEYLWIPEVEVFPGVVETFMERLGIGFKIVEGKCLFHWD